MKAKNEQTKTKWDFTPTLEMEPEFTTYSQGIIAFPFL